MLLLFSSFICILLLQNTALAAEMVGKEASLFVASGTMGNQIAVMSHTQRGNEVILGENSHIMVHESGATAVLPIGYTILLSFII